MRIRKRLPENLGLIEKVSESNMEKLYWVSAIIQNDGDKRAWLCAMTDSVYSIEQAMETINRARANHIVLSAWVDTFDENNVKKTVFHECYVNIVGHVNR